MSLKGFLNNLHLDNLKDAEPTSIDRVLHSPFAPWHRHSNHFHIPHKFPSFQMDGFHDPSHDFGLKFGAGRGGGGGPTGYGHSGGGGGSTGHSGGGYDYTPAQGPAHPPPQSYHPPPMMGKKNKLKGAALSALTLLAFLFFLNLLQNCLKEQMDAMNPTVMVMPNFAPGMARRSDLDKNEESAAESMEKLDDYRSEDYKDFPSDEHADTDADEHYSRISRRMGKSKKEKSTIAPKLQNLFLRNSPQS